LAACAPTLDWREVRVDGGSLVALFPCRPGQRARTVAMVGATVRVEMSACTVAGSTYAVSFIELHDPTAVSGTLEALRAAAVANVSGVRPHVEPFGLAGMTPNPHAARLKVDGRLPDGSEVHEHAAFFVRGLHVYQASVIGAAPMPDAVEAFIGGLKFKS
ncbi:MAG: hypothetical protein M3Y67_01610, partial [Pseudomonadota bacterium]|nr:hypothetical protein [Pseudomonadota bacterium]